MKKQVHPSAYDQPHLLTAIANVNLMRGWHLSFKWRYASGRPYTPVIGRVWLPEDSNSSRSLWQPLEGDKNSKRFPTYHRLDVRLEKAFKFSRGTFITYFEIYNLYNRKNVSDCIWNKNYTEKNSIYQLPSIWALGLAMEL